MTIRLGEFDTSTPIDCMPLGPDKHCLPPFQDFEFERAIAHASYNKTTKANDIGLVRLSRDADFSMAAVATICLPLAPSLMTHVPSHYIVTGWGLTESNRTSQRLLKARVPHVDMNRCQSIFSKALTEKQICAGEENNTGSCSGDSGKLIQNL